MDRRTATIKIEVQLLDHIIVLLLDGETNLAHIRLRPIVEPTIIENKLHVVHEVLNALVLVLSQLSFNGGEVHRILYDVGVVRDLQLLVKQPVCVRAV